MLVFRNTFAVTALHKRGGHAHIVATIPVMSASYVEEEHAMDTERHCLLGWKKNLFMPELAQHVLAWSAKSAPRSKAVCSQRSTIARNVDLNLSRHRKLPVSQGHADSAGP